MLNVEMQTYTYIGSTIVQIYYTMLADIVRHGLWSLTRNFRDDCARLSNFFEA